MRNVPVARFAAGFFVLCLLGLPASAALGEGDSLADVADEVKDAVREKLRDTDFLNSLLEPIVRRAADGPLGFLDDVQLEFRWFDADSAGDDPSLGIAYELGRQIEDWDLGHKDCQLTCRRLGVDLDFSTTGNVAFEKRANPDDFLKTRLALQSFVSLGGALSETPAWRAEWMRLAGVLSSAATQEDVDIAEAAIQTHVAGAIRNQFFLSLGGEIAYESNQSFSSSNLVYGAHAGLDIKGWEDLYAKSWAETRWLSRVNVLDYPFAALRYLTKSADCAPPHQRCFIPEGVTIPTLVAGVSLVDPREDDRRRAIAGDLDSFPRFEVEAAFKTLAFRMGGTNVNFTASYRYFKEIDPQPAIRQAGLDKFDYGVLTLGPTHGPFVRYAVGQLPFDLSSQQVVEVGIHADFAAIKEFLLGKD